MSDIIGDQDEQRYAQAISFQAINAARKIHSEKLLRRGLYASIGLNVMLGIAIDVQPDKQYVPVTGFINEAGIYDQTASYTDLPLATQIAGIESVLANYLIYRERFVPSEADRDYDIVSKLSSDPVRHEYQAFANAKLNPQAPAKDLGPFGFIRVNLVKSAAPDWVTHADNWSSGVYRIHYCRTRVKGNEPPVSQRLEVQIGFAVVAGVPTDQRTTFNAPSINVVSYPTAREEGAPGAANSCA